MADAYAMTGCLLCDEVLSGYSLSFRVKERDHAYRRIVMESANFLLIPDISPLVAGHSLLLPKKHLLCFADLPEDYLAERQEMMHNARSYITQYFSPPLLFEHGSLSTPPRSGVCVQHAHIHLVPAQAPVQEWLEDFGSVTEMMDPFSGLGALRSSLRDYLCFENQNGCGYVVANPRPQVPCQFFRWALAKHLGLPDWNWKTIFERIGRSKGSYEPNPSAENSIQIQRDSPLPNHDETARMMSASNQSVVSRNHCRVKFWEGMEADVDLGALSQSAVPVKGVSHRSPLRFLQIYANDSGLGELSCRGRTAHILQGLDQYGWTEIERTFFPSIPGVTFRLGEDTPQPPFAWRDSDAKYLSLSFTYNTNAFFRILSNLSDRHQLPADDVETFLDCACLALTHIYKVRDYFLIRNINNNLNMFLISKVVEFLVGKNRYDSNCQEMDSTRESLQASLGLVRDYEHLSAVEQMGVALGMGVSFIESRLGTDGLASSSVREVRELSYQYYAKPIAIDHRDKLLAMISDAGLRKNSFTLAAILDDATETVNDLLWMQSLMDQFRFLKVNLLVNTAQISINFSTELLAQVLRAEPFRSLRGRLGGQFLITETYCPFISYQTNYLTPEARRVIASADAVYIKGANFFETCQIPDKETFHAFVVFGPVSRGYTGLRDFEGVFAHVPAGRTGYVHRLAPHKTMNLAEINLDIATGQECGMRAGLPSKASAGARL